MFHHILVIIFCRNILIIKLQFTFNIKVRKTNNGISRSRKWSSIKSKPCIHEEKVQSAISSQCWWWTLIKDLEVWRMHRSLENCAAEARRIHQQNDKQLLETEGNWLIKIQLKFLELEGTKLAIKSDKIVNQTRDVWNSRKVSLSGIKYVKMQRDKQIFVMLTSSEKLKEHRFTVKQKILKSWQSLKQQKENLFYLLLKIPVKTWRNN